jgi:hypothetical protein
VWIVFSQSDVKGKLENNDLNNKQMQNIKLLKRKLFIAALAILPSVSNAQFASEQTINTSESGQSIYAVDIDQDNDVDIVSALQSENKLVWYENLGSGIFSLSNLISDSVSSPYHVIAADLNNDGKQDIISANNGDSSISWFQNLGNGTFSSKITITNSAFNVESIDTADVDNDGDLDLLSGTYFPNGMVAWFENIGSGNFGPQQIISNSNIDVKTVVSSDLNNDSLPDVLVASFIGDVKWFKNLGGGLFDSGQNIGWSFYTFDACAGDIDADGDNDVVASNGAEIFIHENLGNGLFGNQPIVVTSTTSSYGGKISLFDIDSDGLLDILPAETYQYRVIYYKNLGALGFSQPMIVDSATSDKCTDTHSADLDNDGDMDIIASFEAITPNDKLVWYANMLVLNVNEIKSTQDFAVYPNPTSEHLTIKLKENIGKINQFSVYDILGKEYQLDNKQNGNTEYWVNVSTLGPGFYLIKCQTEGGKFYHGELIKE